MPLTTVQHCCDWVLGGQAPLAFSKSHLHYTPPCYQKKEKENVSFLMRDSTKGFKVAQDITIFSHWYQLMKSRWLLLPDHSAITGICTTGHTAHAPVPSAIVHLLWLEKTNYCGHLYATVDNCKTLYLLGFVSESLPFSDRCLCKLNVQFESAVLIERCDFISVLLFLSDLTFPVITLSFKAIRVRFRSPYIGRCCPWRIHGVLKPM